MVLITPGSQVRDLLWAFYLVHLPLFCTSDTISFCSFFDFFSMTRLFTLSLYLSLSQCLSFYKKDELGRDRTCNPQIRSLMRFHCATSPHLFYSLVFVFLFCLPLYSFPFLFFLFILVFGPLLFLSTPLSYSFLLWLLFSRFPTGRFISSRIHPFPSEHGSKDA